jgi:hypothetical protein
MWPGVWAGRAAAVKRWSARREHVRNFDRGEPVLRHVTGSRLVRSGATVLLVASIAVGCAAVPGPDARPIAPDGQLAITPEPMLAEATPVVSWGPRPSANPYDAVTVNDDGTVSIISADDGSVRIVDAIDFFGPPEPFTGVRGVVATAAGFPAAMAVIQCEREDGDPCWLNDIAYLSGRDGGFGLSLDPGKYFISAGGGGRRGEAVFVVVEHGRSTPIFLWLP